MPIYEYKHKKGSGKCKDPFEIIELSSKKAAKVCPGCGEPVERLISVFSPKANVLSNSNLKEKGFTKLVNEGGGRFRKEV